MPGYFIYCRKSSESEDRQVLSVDSQITELKRLATQMKLSITTCFTEARSAKAPGRPIFSDMMTRLKRGEAQGILCWKLDRLARNPIDGGAVIWAIKQQAIEIITPTQHYSPHQENTILMYIEFGMAQKYIDDLSRTVKRGMKAKAEHGWRPGAAPLGYLNDKNDPKGIRGIMPDPDRFPLLRKLWDLMLTGTYSTSEIQRIATDQLGFRSRDNKREKGKPLGLSGMYRLFTNPFYYGEFEFPQGSGLWYQGKHKPMVTQDEFRRVQAILGRPGRPRRQRHAFAFTGLIRCGGCGAMVTAEEKWKRQKNGNVHHYIYYHCTKRRRPRCPQPSIEERQLAGQLDVFLSRTQISEQFKSWALTFLHELHDQEVADRSARYQNLQKTTNDTQRGLDELIRMKYRGLIDDAEYKGERKRLKNELAGLKERLDDTEHRADRWLQLAEQAFELACHARTWFAEGDIQVKKQILEAVGSNLLLKDKILSIEATKPFLVIENHLARVKADFGRFEPPEYGPVKPLSTLSETELSTWRGFVDEVRTCLVAEGEDLATLPILQAPRGQAHTAA